MGLRDVLRREGRIGRLIRLVELVTAKAPDLERP